jgi:hypothetical protein
VHRNLCASGPTSFDWTRLHWGVNLLGRATESYFAFCKGEGNIGAGPCEESARAMHVVVGKEIQAGRPCVIWGAYKPEFAAVVGVEDGRYIVKSYREHTGEEQPPIPFDALECGGTWYALAFPAATRVNPEFADHDAVARAARVLTRRDVLQDYAGSLRGYGSWIRALEAHRAEAPGNSYNSHCYAEAKGFAHEFLKRLAARNTGPVEPLSLAAERYGEVAATMRQLADLFSFPDGGEIERPDIRQQAIEHLKRAMETEAKAITALMHATDGSHVYGARAASA